MDDIRKLISDAINGSQEAFNKLYELTEKDVWFTCISLLKDEQNAKDAMQNTYMAVFLKLDTLTDSDKFCQWIKKIAVNKCKDFLKRKTTLQIDEEELKDIAETDEVVLPEEYITNSENREIIMQIIENALSPIQYQAVIMYYFDDMSIPEIAEIIDCPEGTVMSRLNLARKKIKKAITDYEEKNDDRLHVVVPIPLLASIFKAQSKSIIVPKMNISLPHNLTESNINSADLSAKKLGGKQMLETAKAKIIAAVCVVAAVGIGITAAVASNNEDTVDTPSYESSSLTQNIQSYIDDLNNETDSAAALYNELENSLKDEEGGFFVWDGTKITDLTDEGEEQTELVIPKECTEVNDENDGSSVISPFAKAERISFENPDTILGQKLFNFTYIKHIELPENMKEIYTDMFSYGSLETIVIPDSVEIIGSAAFYSCKELTTVEMSGNNLKELGIKAFYCCGNLTSIDLSNSSLEEIGESAFSDCTSLKSVTLPDTLKKISYNAFFDCYEIEELYIPESVEDISNSAFGSEIYNENKNSECHIYVKEGSWADENFESYARKNSIKEYW